MNTSLSLVKVSEKGCMIGSKTLLMISKTYFKCGGEKEGEEIT